MSCMSLKTFDSLKLNLTKERFPLVVTATGTSMDPIGFTQCTFLINGRSFTQKFIVCTNQTRPVILGKDFSARNCIGIIWTKQGSRRMIDDDNTTIMEVFEQTKDVPLSLANPIRIPPHSIVVAVVECNRPLHPHMDIKGDAGFLREYPNIHVSHTYVNNPNKSSNCIPFSFTNLSMHSQYLGKDKVVGFAEPTTDAVEVHELVDYDEIKEMMQGPRNHVSRKKQAKYKLPAVPIDNAFLTSPADIPGPRKVDLQDADVKPMTRSAFDELCKRYPTIFSRGNKDIGRTQLITMDIDMGDSPPVSSHPYKLALKHHQWVQDEIETLEHAGVITKSMSPWASPIVVVPKKSQHGEPPKKRLCIDFRKINNLQQAVITEGKSKGCLSVVPLPKIDEMYAKLKGAKFFSTIDLRSGGQLEDTQEVHVRNPNYKGKNYDPNYQARKTETNKQQQQPTMANNQYKAPYTRPAANNNNNLASSSDIAGEITLKTTVDGYQLLKMNKLIKNAAAWRARMPKTGRFDKYFDNKETTKPTPKVQINSATLQVMGQAAKDYGYTKDKFIEAVEMYEHFGNVNLEDVPSPSPQD